MKCHLLTGAAALVAIWFPIPANAHEFEVGVASSYIDPTFNKEFSDEPIAKFTGTLNFGDYAYAESYAFTGFNDPGNDQSSEYGAEAGVREVPLAGCLKLNLSAGRYANYNGRGPEIGDWFGRIGVECGHVKIDVSDYRGDTDDTVASGSFKWRLTERFTAVAGVSYQFGTEETNPRIGGEFAFSKGATGSIVVVAPNDLDKDRRDVRISVELNFKIGG